MENKKREEVVNNMIEINKIIAERLEQNNQEMISIEYYNKIQFEGKRAKVEKDDVFIVKIKQNEPIVENTKEKGEKVEERFIYEIYDKDNELIATIDENGVTSLSDNILEDLEMYVDSRDLKDIKIELPKEAEREQLSLGKEELEKEISEREGIKEGKLGKKDEKGEDEEKKDIEQETEDEKKEKAAETLGIDPKSIRSFATIDPNQKVTTDENLIDIMPEAGNYEMVQAVYSEEIGDKGYNGMFTMIGIKEDGTREVLNSVEPVEGTDTDKSVISINEDGSKVERKQVQGLFRINAGNRADGISMSIGDYGRMNIDYVSNIENKETRRAIPMKTEELDGQKEPAYKVMENAADDLDRVDIEGERFNREEKDGVNPQSLDGIDTVGNEFSVDEIKEMVIKEVVQEGESLTATEIDTLIRQKLDDYNLNLTEEETNEMTTDIHEEVIDRLPDVREL